ncbi:MAG: apolipoprotein N-acyltransferase [Flavobacteriales bacterium]|jgi:apolipoprotein N-acyltransferase
MPHQAPINLGLRIVVAISAGYVCHFAFAPYTFWSLAMLCPAVLAFLFERQSLKISLALAYSFGIGLFGGGVSWVFVSINTYGFTDTLPALALTSVFISFLALVFSLPFYIYLRFITPSTMRLLLAFPAIWVLGEWLRTWLFTGFPWLFMGYAHINSSLASWAPIGGVFTLSFLGIFTALALIHSARMFYRRYRLHHDNSLISARISLAFCVVIWLCAAPLGSIEWTQTKGEKVNTVLLQPNIPLEVKWNPYEHQKIAIDLDEMASQHWDADLQIWPEAAIPGVYSYAQDFVDSINTRAIDSQVSILTGAAYDTPERAIYNSIVGLGTATGIYHKQRLVPFGEYMPFEKQLRGLIAFFNLPNSVIEVGPHIKEPIMAKTRKGLDYAIAPYICYEVVYPDLVAASAASANVLVTISNDAWFGDSIGPIQHFQMAQMRALEHQKTMIRATNTGLSGIIDERGHVQSSIKQFERQILVTDIELRYGSTPFTRWGSWPIILMCFGFFAYAIFNSQRKARSQ